MASSNDDSGAATSHRTNQPPKFYAVRWGKHSIHDCIFLSYNEEVMDDASSEYQTFLDVNHAVDYLLSHKLSLRGTPDAEQLVAGAETNKSKTSAGETEADGDKEKSNLETRKKPPPGAAGLTTGKRPRGRPRKNPPKKAKDDAAEKTSAKRKRGRSDKKAKSESKNAASDVAEDSPPKKRKRAPNTPKKAPPHMTWTVATEWLKEFHTKHGNLNIPAANNSDIIDWLRVQYRERVELLNKNKSELTEEKLKVLDDLGVDWDKYAARFKIWGERMLELKAFKAEFGHTQVPKNPKFGRQFYQWTNTIRLEYRRKKISTEEEQPSTYLTPERIAELEALDFDFLACKRLVLTREQEEQEFTERLEQLREHMKTNHSVVVNKNLDPDFGRWILRMKCNYIRLKRGQSSTMTAERIVKLVDAGWTLPQSKEGHKSKISWEERMEQLRQFREENGNLRVTYNSSHLSPFVVRMRAEYRKFLDGKESKLNEEKIHELNELGMLWETPSAWTIRPVRGEDGMYVNQYGGARKPGQPFDDRRRAEIKIVYDRLKKEYKGGKISYARFAEEAMIGTTTARRFADRFEGKEDQKPPAVDFAEDRFSGDGDGDDSSIDFELP